MTFTMYASCAPKGYVDMGLPSGTLWKESNEDGYYTYLSAKGKFGSSLPNTGQYEELMDNCTWQWTGKGFKVTGPNGNSLYFPFDGYIDCDSEMRMESNSAVLWTLEKAGASWAMCCVLSKNQKECLPESNCWSCSVRLVK